MSTLESWRVPTTPTSDAPSLTAVPVLAWPGGADQRQLLAAARRPRILAIPAGVPPPSAVDALEDWVRVPVDVAELELRQRTLQHRWLAGRSDLWLDEYGLLHRGERWVALPAAQASVAALLVAGIGRVVRRDDVRFAYEAAGGDRSDDAFAGVLARLRKKLAELGAVLHPLSGGRLLLEVSSSPTRP